MLHHNEMINIEEDTILGHRPMMRRFTLQNRANHLSIGILTSGGTVSSVKMDNGKMETVVSGVNGTKRDGDNGQAYGQPPQQPTNSLNEWQSHVLGLDTLLLTTSPSQSLLYQLTTNNEIVVTGKLRGHLSALAPFYFNLRSTTANPCTIDGHYLHIKSSDGIPDLPISASADTPFVLTGPVPSKLTYPNDLNVQQQQYDVIFGCIAPPASGSTGAVLVATLTFESRSVEVHLQSNSSTPNQPVKMRVRIRKDGVSLMPAAMNEFKCTYKLFW